MSETRKDGGNAFPVGSDLGPASNIVDGGYGGMSLRDYFAAKAMHGEIDSQGLEGREVDQIAGMAYEMADAMLAARGDSSKGEK